MKIAMVSEHASPLATLGGVDAGGQNVHVAALAAELVAAGHEVVVYTRRDSQLLPTAVRMSSGVVVVHVPAGPPEAIAKDELLPHMAAFGTWMAGHWGRTGPPDVVHAHFWMSGLAALTAARHTGVPVVQTFHALGLAKRRHQGSKDSSPASRIQLEATIGRRVDLIIATCSDEVAELGHMGLTEQQIRVVPCGVDIRLFTPTAPAVTPLRTSTRSADRRPHRLLVVGRLVERKGIDTVIRALPMIPNAELVIAGGPPAAELNTDPEATRLRAVAAEMGVTDRVCMTGGLEHASLPALFRSADVVVCTPWYEPFGIVPLEAASSGRPIVGSAVGGLLDTIDDGVTGLLVPPRQPPALAAAVSELLADPRRRRQIGRAARRRVELRYSWPIVAHDTLAAYRRVEVRPSRTRTTAAAKV